MCEVSAFMVQVNEKTYISKSEIVSVQEWKQANLDYYGCVDDYTIFGTEILLKNGEKIKIRDKKPSEIMELFK